MNEVYQIKSIPVEGTTISDIDEAKGIVVGHFSKFGNVDSDGDMIMPGAFTKSLKENYHRLKHLYQHDSLKPLSSTKHGNLKVSEDKDGLLFESTISKTSWGKDVILLHVDGVIDENSIGFKTIKRIEKKGYSELTELKLWEGSSVTWGANELAQTTGVKGLFTPDMIIKKMDNVLKAIKNGKYENEDLFESLEIYFKQLQQLFIDLSKQATQPAVEAVEPDIKEDKSWLVDGLKSINQIFKPN